MKERYHMPPDLVTAAKCHDNPHFNADPSNSIESQISKNICSRCDIREKCLEEALSQPETGLIQGGTNDKERRKIRRERRLAVKMGNLALVDAA